MWILMLYSLKIWLYVIFTKDLALTRAPLEPNLLATVGKYRSVELQMTTHTLTLLQLAAV